MLLCSFPSANRACPAPRLSGFGSAVLTSTLQPDMAMCTHILQRESAKGRAITPGKQARGEECPISPACLPTSTVSGMLGLKSPSEAVWPLAGCRYMTWTVCFLPLHKGFQHMDAFCPVLKANSTTSAFAFPWMVPSTPLLVINIFFPVPPGALCLNPSSPQTAHLIATPSSHLCTPTFFSFCGNSFL